MPEAIRHLLENCPRCGRGDVAWCHISIRPYCNECGHWGAVNFGSAQEAIKEWNHFNHQEEI